MFFHHLLAFFRDSQQQSRSTSSSSAVTEIQAQPTLSKRKQKAKLKSQQQQQEEKPAIARIVDSDKANVSTPAVATAAPSPVPLTSSISNSSSQGANSSRTNVDLPSENVDSPEEEEVNWITISRKQGKHKPTPPSVPSLLAAPIPPVMSPSSSKPQRQPQATTNTKKNTTANTASIAQHKVIPTAVNPPNVISENGSTNNKQQQNTAPPRLQNVLKNHASHQPQKVEPSLPSVQPWANNNNTNVYEHSPGIDLPNVDFGSASFFSYLVMPSVISPSVLSSSTLHHTAPAYVPTHTATPPPVPIGGGPSIPPSSMYWDPNGYIPSSPSSSSSPTRFLASTAPGPVQRPNSSFSPAPGAVNNTTASRCIQRPSPEPRSCSTNSVPFPLYSPMNYAVGNSNSTWSETPATNTHESQWNYPQEQQQLGPSTPANDFPLYDPFHSGATLTIPSTVQRPLLTNGFSGRFISYHQHSPFHVFTLQFLEHFEDFCDVPLNHEVNEMDALDKEIEDFKK